MVSSEARAPKMQKSSRIWGAQYPEKLGHWTRRKLERYCRVDLAWCQEPFGDVASPDQDVCQV